MLFQTDLISSVQKKGTFLKHSFYFFLYNENEWGLGSSSKLTKKASWKYHKTWLVLYIMSLMKSYYIFVWWTDQKMLLTENEVTMFDSQKINNLVTNQMDTVFKVSSLIRLMWISEQCFIFSMFVILRHCMIFLKIYNIAQKLNVFETGKLQSTFVGIAHRKKNIILCSTEETKSNRFRPTWVEYMVTEFSFWLNHPLIVIIWRFEEIY